MSRFDSPADPAIDLSQFDEAFRSASAPPAGGGAGQEIPDGAYDAVIEDIAITRTPRTGNPMVTWRLRITGPSCQGRALTKNNVITQKSVSILKDELSRCGLELDRLSDLSGRIPELLDLRMRIVKKTKEGWTDVYIVKSLSRAKTELDDDLPF